MLTAFNKECNNFRNKLNDNETFEIGRHLYETITSTELNAFALFNCQVFTLYCICLPLLHFIVLLMHHERRL